MSKAMIVSDKKKILIRDDHPDRLTTVIPSSKKITYRGVDLVVVPHALDETKVLNNLGFNIPSPVETYYHWPCRYDKPMHAQVVTTGNMTLDTRHFVLNQIGTGKTLSVLWAFDYLRSIGKATKMLVITPLSTMESVWVNEVWEHLPHLQTQVLYGSAEKRLAQLEFPADIYIINHDGIKVPEVLKALVDRIDITVLCVDELADFKNAGTDRFKALKKISMGRDYFWGLTGTPIPNKVTDAWAQCRLINPSRVSEFFGAFREKVMRKVSLYKWVPRSNALDIVKDAMQPATLFKRDECMDLPPTMYETRHVEMTDEQKKAYKQMMNDLVAQAADGQIVAVNEAVKMSKLCQIACISSYTPVLCSRGWVPIKDVTATDIVWDGEEWVSHEGAIFKGTKFVTECGGIELTPDHMLLTKQGWKTAKELHNGNACERLDWYEVRLPASFAESRFNNWKNKVCSMVVSMRLRSESNKNKSISSEQTPKLQKKLWMPPWKRDSQNELYKTLQYMGKDEISMFESSRQRLEQLWWSWNNSMSRMEDIIRSILEGYAQWIFKEINFGKKGQQSRIQQSQLSVGDCYSTSQQQKNKYTSTNSRRLDDNIASSQTLWPEARNYSCQDQEIRMGCQTSCVDVYDIVNCGPRNRFVVRGLNGELRIVHNCGVAYGQAGEVLHIKSETRMEELKTLVAASEGKVIVFVPLTGGLESVAKELGKTWKTEVVYGEVSKSERDRIFAEFRAAGWCPCDRSAPTVHGPWLDACRGKHHHLVHSDK